MVTCLKNILQKTSISRMSIVFEVTCCESGSKKLCKATRKIVRTIRMESVRFCNFCRLCLCSSRGLLDVFDDSSQSGLAVRGIIQDLLHLKIVKDTIQQWMICQSCMCQLHAFQRFKDRCIRSKLVIDGMFQLGADGVISDLSTKYKRIEFKDGRKSQLEEGLSKVGLVTEGATRGITNHFHEAQRPSPAGSVIHPLIEEANDDRVDTVIEFCWCWDCGNEFLSKQELVVHSDWCRGREKLVPFSINEDSNEEKLKVDDFLGNINQPLLDPNICCGICRRMFKTREHLIRHINKYDFHCKPKDSPSSPIVPETAVSLDENEVHPLCIHHDRDLKEQNVPHKKNKEKSELKLDVTKCPTSLIEQNQLKFLTEKQGSTSKRMAVLDAEGSENKHNMNKTIPRPEDLTLGNFNMSSSQQIALNTTHIERNNTSTECLKTKDVLSQASTVFVDARLIKVREVVSYICDYCEKSYVTKPEMRSHIVKCHLALDPQKCKVCHRLFTNSEELEQHSHLHPKDKKFYCTVCEESFRYRLALRRHIKEIHGVIKPYICSLCCNGFTSRNDIGLHASLVHTDSEKPFKCTKCGKSYTYKKDFVLHVKVCQLKTVSFQCNICGKYQTSQGNLLNHTLMHSDERKFPCPKCPKSFKLSGSRNAHIRAVHLKQEPYECGICNKRFSVKYHLNQHYISHSDARPFVCSECPRSFKMKSALKNHLLRLHNIS